MIAEAGIPAVGTLLTPNNGFGETVICIKCRHAGMKTLTGPPEKPKPPSPPGWNIRRPITEVVNIEDE